MPCDSIRLTGVQLEKCNAKLMCDALIALGYSPNMHPDGHTIVFESGQTIDCATGAAQLGRYLSVNEIKRAYSAAIVKATAKKFGWAPQANNTNEEFVYNRR